MNNNFHLLWFIRLPKINHVILFFCFILLFYTLPVYNQVHIKERVEIIPASQDKQRDFREFYNRVNELFNQNKKNILVPNGLGSFTIPLQGDGVYLSHILIMRGELGFEDPGISTGLEDLSFTINSSQQCSIKVNGESSQVNNLLIANQPYAYCGAT